MLLPNTTFPSVSSCIQCTAWHSRATLHWSWSKETLRLQFNFTASSVPDHYPFSLCLSLLFTIWTHDFCVGVSHFFTQLWSCCTNTTTTKARSQVTCFIHIFRSLEANPKNFAALMGLAFVLKVLLHLPDHANAKHKQTQSTTEFFLFPWIYGRVLCQQCKVLPVNFHPILLLSENM